MVYMTEVVLQCYPHEPHLRRLDNHPQVLDVIQVYPLPPLKGIQPTQVHPYRQDNIHRRNQLQIHPIQIGIQAVHPHLIFLHSV